MSVVWLNGPVGSGKTTLAHALRALVRPVAAVALLDEDQVRDAISDATAEGETDGAPPAARLSGLARVLAQQGLVVVVAASDSQPPLLLWNRENLPGYCEVYLAASADMIRHRRRRQHPVEALPRIPEPLPPSAVERGKFGPPPPPDLTIDMDNPEPPELLAFRVAVLIPEFVVAAAGAATLGQNRLRRGA